MKAQPVKLVRTKGYVRCTTEYATHLMMILPWPVGRLILPITKEGAMGGVEFWRWNGCTANPTLEGKIKFTEYKSEEKLEYTCSFYIDCGFVYFLYCNPFDLSNKIVPLMDIKKSYRINLEPTKNIIGLVDFSCQLDPGLAALLKYQTDGGASMIEKAMIKAEKAETCIKEERERCAMICESLAEDQSANTSRKAAAKFLARQIRDEA